MANGQALDPHAKVSDGQIKCLVSEEIDDVSKVYPLSRSV